MAVVVSASAPRGHRIQLGEVIAASLLSVLLVIGVWSSSALVPANETFPLDPQSVYAHNLWSQVQPSLALLGLFFPWLYLVTLRRHSLPGRGLIPLVTAAAVVVLACFTLVGLYDYTQPPIVFLGQVRHLQGREIAVERCSGLSGNLGPTCSTETYRLIMTDTEFRAETPFLTDGSLVEVWVSPQGDAGYAGVPTGTAL